MKAPLSPSATVDCAYHTFLSVPIIVCIKYLNTDCAVREVLWLMKMTHDMTVTVIKICKIFRDYYTK